MKNKTIELIKDLIIDKVFDYTFILKQKIYNYKFLIRSKLSPLFPNIFFNKRKFILVEVFLSKENVWSDSELQDLIIELFDPDPFTTTFYQDPVFLVDSDTGYITLKELREMNYD